MKNLQLMRAAAEGALRIATFALVVAPAAAGTLERTIPTTTALSRSALGNETQAGRRTSLRIPEGMTNRTTIAIPNAGMQGKRVILEDDWPVDVDDIAAVDFALELMDQGYINVLATPFAGYSYSNQLAVPMIDAICRYYGHPDILQCGSGLITDGSGTPSALWYPGPFPFESDIVTNGSSAYPDSTNYPTALSTYRWLLENSPSNSVTIVLGGPPANLWDLWRSPPDQYSPMNGADLIRSRVSEIVMALGTFPTNPPVGAPDYVTDNLNYGLSSSGPRDWSWIVNTNLGVPVTFMPLNVSGSTMLVTNNIGPGGTVINRPHDDPTYMALHDWMAVLHGDGSDGAMAYNGEGQWTTLAVLYAAFGTNTWNGAQLFNRVTGNIYWRYPNPAGGAAPAESWNTNGTANGNQGYATIVQPPVYYYTIYSNYFGTSATAPVSSFSIAPGGGGTLTLSYSGGAGGHFILLQTNNLAAPMSTWPRVKTNTSGPGSFTITPGAHPTAFYRIKSE